MPVTRIISSKPRLFPDLGEAWEHWHLAVMMARRNIKIRYMQTMLGSIWIIIQPILLTGAITLIGGILLAAPSQGLPYILFAFTGTTIWNLFQRTLIDTSTSLAISGPIILKVYFPRILVPVSSALTAAFDTIPVFALMLLVTVFYGYWPGWHLLAAPLFLFMALMMAFGIGLWVTMLDAVYRDIRLMVPSLLQIGFYLSPIMYSEERIPPHWRFWYDLNPVVGLIHGFRWATIAGLPPPDPLIMLGDTIFILVSLVAGLVIFARLEQYAVDKI